MFLLMFGLWEQHQGLNLLPNILTKIQRGQTSELFLVFPQKIIQIIIWSMKLLFRSQSSPWKHLESIVLLPKKSTEGNLSESRLESTKKAILPPKMGQHQSRSSRLQIMVLSPICCLVLKMLYWNKFKTNLTLFIPNTSLTCCLWILPHFALFAPPLVEKSVISRSDSKAARVCQA